MLFHIFDVGNVIVLAHFHPTEVPVLTRVDIKRLVFLAVLGATVARHPHVKAVIEEPQWKWIIVSKDGRVIRIDPDPTLGIASQPMHKNDWGPVRISLYRVTFLACDVEGCQDKAVICLDFVSVPCITPEVHV